MPGPGTRDARRHPFDGTVAAFVADCRARNLSPRTIEFYLEGLTSYRTFAGGGTRHLTLADVELGIARAWLAELSSRELRPSTVAARARALRVFGRWIEAESYVRANPLIRLRMPVVPRTVIETFTAEQARALLMNAPVHLAIVLRILLDTGLRIGEATALCLGDVGDGQFRVVGKGGHERAVPPQESTVPAPMAIDPTWLAQTGSGSWVAGSANGPTISLPRGEVGVASGNGWVVSASRQQQGDSLLWRRLSDSKPRSTALTFVPVSGVVVGDRAYLAGFDIKAGDDSGIQTLDLTSGVLTEVLSSSHARAIRTVVVSPSGHTVTSAICVDPEAGCELDVVHGENGDVHHLAVPGFLRATGDDVAIVGSDPATWVAGIDLQTGKELWRRQADEMWLGYVTSDGYLVQASLAHTPSGPVFSVERIDLHTGSAAVVVRRPASGPIGLWPELSTDDEAVVGPGFNIDDALNAAPGTAVRADVFRVSDGARTKVELTVGGNR